MPRPDFQDYLVHASHKALYRYWYSRRAGDGIPREQSFDPAQTGALAPALGIVEVVRQESRIRFRHRYSGTPCGDPSSRSGPFRCKTAVSCFTTA